MFRAFGSVFAAAILASSPAAGQPRLITEPDWLAKPKGEDLASAYPQIAQKLFVEGRAVIACRVTDTGLLTGCITEEEDPAGFGFGRAALAMSSAFRMRPMTLNGEPVGGGQVRIPINFRLPAEQHEPPPLTDAAPEAIALARRNVDAIGVAGNVAEAFDRESQTLTSGSVGVSPEFGPGAAQALRAAAAAMTPEIAEQVARIEANTVPIETLRALAAFSDTPAGRAILRNDGTRQAAELAANSAFTAAAADAARAAYCASRDCRANEDPVSLARDSEGAHPAVRISQPRWAETPTIGQLLAGRPPMARWLKLGGYVRLTCTADPVGALRDCVVAHEAPAGLGFGAAALAKRGYFRLSSTLLTEGAAGERVAVIVRFPQPPGLGPMDPPEPRSATSLRLAKELLEARFPLSVHEAAWRRQLDRQFPDAGPGGGASKADVEAFKAAMWTGFHAGRETSRQVLASLLGHLLTDDELKKGLAFWKSPAGQAWTRRLPDLQARNLEIQRAYSDRIHKLAGRIFCEEHGCVGALATPAPPLPSLPVAASQASAASARTP